MTFKIEVKGLKEIERKLGELQEGLTLDGLRRWATEIETDAKAAAAQRSLEAGDSIHVEVIEAKPKEFHVTARAKEEAWPFIVEATRNKLKVMPLTSRAIFSAFIDRFEKMLKKP